MTDTVADPVSASSTSPDDDTARNSTARRSRMLLIASAVAAVIPFFWAAIRDGRNGFYPTLDVAATIIRSRATFSAHPPLYGMWSSGSSWAGHEIHFPGPILLYLLAVPTHLFGNTWGPILGMALINAGFVLMTGWVIYRRLGVRAGLIGFLILNVFIWSLGSENLIDPRPMEMVTIPFLCFLLLVWLVTSGEFDALPALAVTANYLFLNHLVMALQVPMIGLCAVVGVALYWRRTRARRAVPGTVPDEPDAALRRLRRRVIQTGIITFVMWIPTLIQQFTTSPGNLTLLVKATGQHREPVGSYIVSYNATIGLIAKPSFWFRGRFDNPSYPYGLQNLTLGSVAAGVVLLAVVVGLGALAWRRRDHLSLGALIVAIVAFLVSVETVSQAPAVWGFPMQYLRSLWGLAAFVWFAVAFSAYRAVSDRLQGRVASLAGVGAVVFGVLALSYANFGSATDMKHAKYARDLVDEVVPQLADRGKIRVSSGSDFTSQRFFSSLLLGLDTAGIPFCVDHHTAQQYGEQHDCAGSADVHVFVQAPKRPDFENSKLIARVPLLTRTERVEVARSKKVFETWLAEHASIELTPWAYVYATQSGAHWRERLTELVNPPDGDLSSLIDSDWFRLVVGLEATAQKIQRKNGVDSGKPVLFADPDTPIDAMIRYFELTDTNKHGDIWVYELPEKPRR